MKKKKRKVLRLWLGFGVLLYVTPILAAIFTENCVHQDNKNIVYGKVPIKPLGFLSRLADKLMLPFMYLVAGTFKEEPQRTHRWNNCKFRKESIAALDTSIMLTVEGIPETKDRGIIRFHVPVFGGWKNYVVLRPAEEISVWHLGWVADDVGGISRIPIKGEVRALIGPRQTSFFGVRASDGKLIQLRKAGSGRIGDGGKYANVLLL